MARASGLAEQNDPSQVAGMVFDIQHFSLHDGPGVRSTVFFKGCPLACRWCSNPESQDRRPELLHFGGLCSGCGACAAVCPSAASGAPGAQPERQRCTACGACVLVCPQDARVLTGRMRTVEEVCAEVRQHWRIFSQSGGGVTCSGGEALFQERFLCLLLRSMKEEAGLHTCLETSGYASWKTLERALAYLDLVLLDIKHMDASAHCAGTGVGNGRILENARRLAKSGVPVIVRLPLVPGYNDTDANVRALGAFVRDAALPAVEIMPYHTLGSSKYAALGRVCGFQAAGQTPRVARAEEILRGYGLMVDVHAR